MNQSDQYWYLDKKYAHYWKNYIYCMNFINPVNENASNFTQFLYPSYENYINASIDAKQAAHLAALSKLNNREEFPNHFKTKKTKETDIEFEITEDLVKFYEESIRYKTEKKEEEKKTLKKLASGEITDYVSGEQVKSSSTSFTVHAPLERVGLKREEELKILYGEKASMIHLKETNFQMKHDKNYDMYQPVYWPSFPLKLKFN